jgi:hypothetical protein
VTITTIRPTGISSTSSGMTYAGGATTAYGALSDNSDTTYVQAHSDKASIRFKMQPVTVAATQRVRSCQIRIRTARDGGGAPTQTGLAKFNDNISTSLSSCGQINVSRNSTSILTSVGPLAFNAPGGLAWTQARVNSLGPTVQWFEACETCITFLRVHELYVDVDIVNQPTLSTPPTITNFINNAMPTVTWQYADIDNEVQVRWNVKIFNSTQVSAGNFDPELSANSWDSGEQSSAVSSVTVPKPLLNGSTFYAYVKVAKTWQGASGGYYWSSWVPSSSFTLTFPLPYSPILTVTSLTDSNACRALIVVDAPINLLDADTASLETGLGMWVNPNPFVSPPVTGGYTPRTLGAYGTYIADDTNTGITTSRSGLTSYNYPGTSPLTCTTNGQVFESLEIFGDVVIAASNVRFQNCLFRGPRTWQTNDGAIIDCNSSSCFGAWIRDCTFMPQLPQYYRNAIIGHEYLFERNRVIWCNDAIGAFSKPGLPNATNVKVAGNYCTDQVYWQGTVAAYPGQVVGDITVSPTYASPFIVPGYPIKDDGTHNDCCQIQGGLGGTKSIWVIGNTFINNDADQAAAHPLGYVDPIPQLGTQNNPKRFLYGTSTPYTMLDGKYASNGQAIVIQQNTYQFPATDTCVVENNRLNDFGQGANIQALAGGFTTIKCTFQNNTFGENMYAYVYPSDPSTYPIRIDSRAGATITGLSTNTWYQSHWGTIGASLTEGRTLGIRYDN